MNDTITLNGVTKTITIFGQNNVTDTADVLTIFAGTPVYFGSYEFTLEASSYNGTAVGQDLPLDLSAIVATPEPATFALLGTGLISVAAIRSRRFTTTD